jgi:hypothetical protein
LDGIDQGKIKGTVESRNEEKYQAEANKEQDEAATKFTSTKAKIYVSKTKVPPTIASIQELRMGISLNF